MESELKRFHEDADLLSWREGSAFADWTLCWGSDSTAQSTVRYRVHRFVLVRTCRFFRGAMNEDFKAESTDLSKLFPADCKALVEPFLDGLYEGPAAVGPLAISDLGHFYTMADTLQCPTLKNHVIDLFGQHLADREVSRGTLSLVQAVASTRHEALFKAMLPRFPVEALRMALTDFIRDGHCEFALPIVDEMARRAAPPTSTWYFVVQSISSYASGVPKCSEPIFVRGTKFVLEVYPKGDEVGRDEIAIILRLCDFEEGVPAGSFRVCFGIRRWTNNTDIPYSDGDEWTWEGDSDWCGDDMGPLSGLIAVDGVLRPRDDAVQFYITVL